MQQTPSLYVLQLVSLGPCSKACIPRYLLPSPASLLYTHTKPVREAYGALSGSFGMGLVDGSSDLTTLLSCVVLGIMSSGGFGVGWQPHKKILGLQRCPR